MGSTFSHYKGHPAADGAEEGGQKNNKKDGSAPQVMAVTFRFCFFLCHRLRLSMDGRTKE